MYILFLTPLLFNLNLLLNLIHIWEEPNLQGGRESLDFEKFCLYKHTGCTKYRFYDLLKTAWAMNMNYAVIVGSLEFLIDLIILAALWP
jgi:hypothetical protein